MSDINSALLFCTQKHSSPVSTRLICCGLVIQQAVQQVHKKSNKWSPCFTDDRPHDGSASLFVALHALNHANTCREF